MNSIVYPYELEIVINDDNFGKEIIYHTLDAYPVTSTNVAIQIKAATNCADIFKRLLFNNEGLNAKIKIVLYQKFDVDDERRYNIRKTDFAIVPLGEPFCLAPTYIEQCKKDKLTLTYDEIVECLQTEHEYEYVEWEYIGTLLDNEFQVSIYRKIRNLKIEEDESNT